MTRAQQSARPGPRQGAPGRAPRRAESGSYRDPGGFIFTLEERIFRAIHPRYREDWEAFSASPLFEELQRRGLLIPTRPAASEPRFPARVAEMGAIVVEHERVPFVSYPYEWSFEMLKDAALLHLDLIEQCLPHNFILKDASAFNVQFVGSRPVFIDVLSFARLQPGEPWAGYNQFCKMFLYPLMLAAYRNVPFQSWLRSELEGLDPILFARLLSARDLFRPGVFSHVWLHALLQRRMENSQTSVRRRIKSAGLSKEAIAANVRGLRRLLNRLKLPAAAGSTWADYASTHTYSDEAVRQKEDFVRRACTAERPHLVWDLGCNVGRFSRVAAEHADFVVALDADPVSIDRLYRLLKQEGRGNVLPLVMNLANLSPNQGWDGTERRSPLDRGTPDLTLCLALLHHMVISGNVPVEVFVGWLAGLGSALVIEFVSKEDPQTRRLLLNKDDTYDDYTRPGFESCLEKFFSVRDTLALPGGTRWLYSATPRQQTAEP
jgi:ribosomal protein L11 methylase PrmA